MKILRTMPGSIPGRNQNASQSGTDAGPSQGGYPLLGYNRPEVLSPFYGRYDAVAGLPISTFGVSLLSNSAPRARVCHNPGGRRLTRPPRISSIVRKPLAWRSLPAVCLLASSFGLAQAPAPPPAPAASAPPAPAAPTSRPQPRFVVLLDAAHGGDDNGGQIGTAVAEKTVTLALSVRLRSLLTARGFPVITTREGNLTLDADARAQVANRATPAACLVLHATQSGAGVHLFTSAIASTQPTRFLAWKTAQSAYITRSLRLAGMLNAAFAKGGDTVLPATLARATLPGLDSLACPAVVIELAPERASDGSIAADVTDPAYQAQVAETIAGAILAWKAEWEESVHDSGHAGGHQP